MPTRTKTPATVAAAADRTLTAAFTAGLLDPALDASLAAAVRESAAAVDHAEAAGGKRSYAASVHVKALEVAGLLPGSRSRRELKYRLEGDDDGEA